MIIHKDTGGEYEVQKWKNWSFFKEAVIEGLYLTIKHILMN